MSTPLCEKIPIVKIPQAGVEAGARAPSPRCGDQAAGVDLKTAAQG
ncbi:MAG TPA: hypothetical protein VMK12_00240 [Anaeromyxobacteraceae bacterium]|nr:hypothetical protein [Anaeromyxobacteraceae bacterium]